MAYFLTHLLFLGKIRDVPLYELDAQDVRSKVRAAGPYALLSLVQHNLSLISDSVPSEVFLDCGINVDQWYPLPRRMIATAGFMRAHRRKREHCRRALDTLRERFDVRCGPVIYEAPFRRANWVVRWASSVLVAVPTRAQAR
jgi:hypothetical protein